MSASEPRIPSGGTYGTPCRTPFACCGLPDAGSGGSSSRRCKQLAALTTLALIGVALLLWLAPAWLLWKLVAAGVAGLGYAGCPRNGKPLILPATAPTGVTPLTNGIVLEALCSLGISKMTNRRISN
jgi:hypothetical protein